MSHAAHDSDLIGDFRTVGHVGAKVGPRNTRWDRRKNTSILGGRIGLWIKAIHVRKSTLKVDMDHRFCLGHHLTLLGLSLQVQVLTEGQPNSA